MKTIGLVLERVEDAKQLNIELNKLYHWRVPKEIDQIKHSLEKLGYEVRILGTPKECLANIETIKREIDFIFNLSVGFISNFRLAEGPLLYELAELPYSGAGPYTKMITQNKHVFKSLMTTLEIPTPKWTYIEKKSDLKRNIFKEYPLFVKPAYEGSSIGIDDKSLVKDYKQLEEKVCAIIDGLNMPVIVEKFIVGQEYKVGILGNGPDKQLYMIEDIKTNGESLEEEFLYFDVKKKGSYSKRLRSIDEEKFRDLKEMCTRVYDHFSPVDYGTFDIRGDKDGNFYIIEFNADATLHPDRTLAKCCELNGLDYETMISRIMTASLQRQRSY